MVFLDAYRRAVEHGDIRQVFPFLGEGVTWWSGEPEGRLRTGLRDTLLGIEESDLPSRLPGRFFVLAYPLAGGLGYDIDWVHEAVFPPAECSGIDTCHRFRILHLTIRPGGIVGHSVSPLTADLRGAADVDAAELQRIEARYLEIAQRLSSADPEYAAEMMSDRPVWIDTGDGLERIDPRGQWAEQSASAFADKPDSGLTPMVTTDLGFSGPPEPVVFFTPGEAVPWFREATIGGIGLYRWSPSPGQSAIVAVEWFEQPHGIIQLAFMLQPPDFSVVLADDSNPWMADPTLWPQVPGAPRQLTGTIDTSNEAILLYNGSASQQELVEWALDRYTSAGLPAPTPRSITFPPNADCVIYAGLAIDTGEGVDLQLCFEEQETCVGEACTPSVTAQSTLLHELGHVWTIQTADEATRAAFLDVRGLDVWSAPDLGRDLLGTEHAAEILSWGLMETDTTPARLPDNDCPDLADAFRVLTGREMPRVCSPGSP